MSWIKVRNHRVVNTGEIPLLSVDVWQQAVLAGASDNLRPLMLFGQKKDAGILVYCGMGDDDGGYIHINSCLFEHGNQGYPSFTKDFPQFSMFERELYEATGILPVGHPWLKSVRFPFNRIDQSNTMENYPFFKVTGDEVHEVAVGPVHAGIIEPGHFRFICHGENVHHLEIQLGYQHRGIESILPDLPPTKIIRMAESIAGDSTLAHAHAAVCALESLAEMTVPLDAQLTRLIALELERIAMHIGDLSALAGDVAYLIGNAVLGARRTLVINLLLAFCGNRFGRGLITLGGVNYLLNEELTSEILNTLKVIQTDVTLICEYMFAAPSVLSRFEHTGTLTLSQAHKVGLVGMAARASGLGLDVRKDFPSEIFSEINFKKITLSTGDVFARAMIRFQEIIQSIDLIRQLLGKVNSYSSTAALCEVNYRASSMAVSLVEGWRGEIVHTIVTDEQGCIARYKIKDPSFNNWFGLALAMRNNGISDFPLCNKSFNLSYCGHDL